MTTSQKDPEKRLSDFLTQHELFLITRIAKEEGVDRQHATAILSLNQGLTQNQAAEKAGLTRWQVKYWIGKFRKQRMNIFPDSVPEIGAGDNLKIEEVEPSVPILNDQKSKIKEIKTEKNPQEIIGEKAKIEKKKKKGKNEKKSTKKKKGKKSKKDTKKEKKQSVPKKLKKGSKNSSKKKKMKRKKKK